LLVFFFLRLNQGLRGCAPETENKVRLTFQGLFKPKRKRSRFDYSSFTRRLVLETRCFVVDV